MIPISQSLKDKLKANRHVIADGTEKKIHMDITKKYISKFTWSEAIKYNLGTNNQIEGLSVNPVTGETWFASYNKTDTTLYIHSSVAVGVNLNFIFKKSIVIPDFKHARIAWDMSFSTEYPRVFFLMGTEIKEWVLSSNTTIKVYHSATFFDIVGGNLLNNSKQQGGLILTMAANIGSDGSTTLFCRKYNSSGATEWSALPSSYGVWDHLQTTLTETNQLIVTATIGATKFRYVSSDRVYYGDKFSWQPRITPLGFGDMLIYRDGSVHEIYTDNSGESKQFKITYYKADMLKLNGDYSKTTTNLFQNGSSGRYTIQLFNTPFNYTWILVKDWYHKYTIYKYTYGLDASDYIESMDVSHQVDNPIAQLNANLAPIIRNFSTNNILTLGSRIDVYSTIGLSYPNEIQLGVFYIDDLELNKGEMVPISARNATGMLLKDVTLNNYSWPVRSEWIGQDTQAVINRLFEDYLYYYNYHVEATNKTLKREVVEPFKSTITNLEFLEQLLDYENDSTIQYKFVLKEDVFGKIYFMRDTNYNGQYPISYFIFDEDNDMFSKSIKINMDDVASILLVECDNADFNNKLPESIDNPKSLYTTMSLENYPFIQVEARKTVVVHPPYSLGYSDPGKYGIKDFAKSIVDRYHYRGVTVDYIGKFRPEVMVGDITELTVDGYGKVTGTINSVKHSFSISGGYRTSISVATGGKIVIDGNNIYNDQVKARTGSNRMQRVSDIIRLLK